MKLYYHPISTTSRPVVQLCQENDIQCELVVVDLLTGEHMKEPFSDLNANCLVPVLDDDGWVLTESSSILKYLAEKHALPVYPAELRPRAKVNEIMDWFNSNFYRDYGYQLIYPQLFAHHMRQPEDANTATINWGRDKSHHWLTILDQHVLDDGRAYLCGEALTIADYFGSALIDLGRAIRVDLSAYPNVARWLAAMRRRPSWAQVYEMFNGYCDSLKEKPFISIGN